MEETENPPNEEHTCFICNIKSDERVLLAAEQDGSLHKEDTKMGKRLENLRSIVLWVSYIRCIKGCLNYLKMDVSTAWLFGATGYAFIINIPEGLDVSGPTALNHQEMFFGLGENKG